jgi:hypothetical protein
LRRFALKHSHTCHSPRIRTCAPEVTLLMPQSRESTAHATVTLLCDTVHTACATITARRHSHPAMQHGHTAMLHSHAACRCTVCRTTYATRSRTAPQSLLPTRIHSCTVTHDHCVYRGIRHYLCDGPRRRCAQSHYLCHSHTTPSPGHTTCRPQSPPMLHGHTTHATQSTLRRPMCSVTTCDTRSPPPGHTTMPHRSHYWCATVTPAAALGVHTTCAAVTSTPRSHCRRHGHTTTVTLPMLPTALLVLHSHTMPPSHYLCATVTLLRHSQTALRHSHGHGIALLYAPPDRTLVGSTTGSL